MASGWGEIVNFHAIGLHLVWINAMLLPSGKVLMYSRNPATENGNTHSTFAYTWDASTATATPVPAHNPMSDMFCSGMVVLPDGRVFAAGGHIADDTGTLHTNLFNTLTNQWVRGPYMAYPRWYPTCTTLPDGRVFIASGTMTPSTGAAPVPEIYDPKTNRVFEVPSATMRQHYYPFHFVAPNGKLFWAGGGNQTYMNNGKVSRFLNLATMQWEPMLETAEAGTKYGSAVMYEPGKILKSGGKNARVYGGPEEVFRPSTAAADLIDLNLPNPKWVSKQSGKSVQPMNFNRWQHTLTVLPDGTVFCNGGTNRVYSGAEPEMSGDQNYTQAELFTPGTDSDGQPTGTWTLLPGNAQRPRWYHSTQLLLPDGRILTMGGDNSSKPPVPHDQELAQYYYPPYFDLYSSILPQPQIPSCPPQIRYGTKFRVAHDANLTNPAPKAALIALGSVTHGFDMNQRLVWLPYDHLKKELAAPVSPNIAPPGYYMLFLLDRRGDSGALAPSKASIVRVMSAPTSGAMP